MKTLYKVYIPTFELHVYFDDEGDYLVDHFGDNEDTVGILLSHVGVKVVTLDIKITKHELEMIDIYDLDFSERTLKNIENRVKKAIKKLNKNSRPDSVVAQAPWKIVGDDSGHDYIIPKSKMEEFELWVKWNEDYDAFDYKGEDFDNYRIDGAWSLDIYDFKERD